jgi:hypothetical protein
MPQIPTIKFWYCQTHGSIRSNITVIWTAMEDVVPEFTTMGATGHMPSLCGRSLYTYRTATELTKTCTIGQGHWLEELPCLLYTHYSQRHKFRAGMNCPGFWAKYLQTGCSRIYLCTCNFKMFWWFRKCMSAWVQYDCVTNSIINSTEHSLPWLVNNR